MFVPFAACVLIANKVHTVLVDGVVGEMHAHIILTLERHKADIDKTEGVKFAEQLQFVSRANN